MFCGGAASEENTGFACAGNCKAVPTAAVEKKQHSPVLRPSEGPQAEESKLWTIAELDPYLPASRSTYFEIYMCSEKEAVTPFYQIVHIVKMALLNTFVDNLPQDLHFMTTYKSVSEE